MSRGTFRGMQDGHLRPSRRPVQGRKDYFRVFDRDCKSGTDLDAIMKTVPKGKLYAEKTASFNKKYLYG
jgi:hypothetical protein